MDTPDIHVKLSRIIITEMGEQQVIFLKEVDGERTFPILIGISEALAIDRRLKGIPTPRPMTHDLLAGVIEAMGGRLEKIIINDLREHTFYAQLFIRRNGETIEVDSRPSDAIALGVAMDTPLYVTERVLEGVTTEGPVSRGERLELLRQRQAALADQIAKITDKLAGSEFLSSAPEDIVERYRRQLTQMQVEHDAIKEILNKLG